MFDIIDERAPKEFTELKNAALNCNDPEEAFKLKYKLERWDIDCFDSSELIDASRNYNEAMSHLENVIKNYLCNKGISQKKYRDVTHTQDLRRLFQRYEGSRIIELGEIKLLTWKKDLYILTRKQKIERQRKMRKTWKEEKNKNGTTIFKNYKDFVKRRFGIPIV